MQKTLDPYDKTNRPLGITNITIMEYVFGLLGVIVGYFLTGMFPNPFAITRDKAARKAIVALGKEFNRDIYMYDHIDEVLVHVKDFDKEAYCQKLTVAEGRKNVQGWTQLVNDLRRDLSLVTEHLGLKFETTQSTRGIVKFKK